MSVHFAKDFPNICSSSWPKKYSTANQTEVDANVLRDFSQLCIIFRELFVAVNSYQLISSHPMGKFISF